MHDKKYIIFDLDGTLAYSRSVLSNDMADSLRLLEGICEVVVISGAQKSQMLKQIPWLEDSLFTVMSQSGNYAQKEDKTLWENNLSIKDLHSVLLHLGDLGIPIRNDMLEIRGGQATLSLLGHNADKEKKKKYDPRGLIRKEMLDKVPFDNEEMIVRVGGTTCFDYTKVGWGKKGNLEKLFMLNGWKFDDAIYVGDQLYEGGNDEDVMDIIDVVSVENPEETLTFIKEELL